MRRETTETTRTASGPFRLRYWAVRYPIRKVVAAANPVVVATKCADHDMWSCAVIEQHVRLAAMAEELVQAKPDVLVAGVGTLAPKALRTATALSLLYSRPSVTQSGRASCERWRDPVQRDGPEWPVHRVEGQTASTVADVCSRPATRRCALEPRYPLQRVGLEGIEGGCGTRRFLRRPDDRARKCNAQCLLAVRDEDLARPEAIEMASDPGSETQRGAGC
jgi:hypothetical protein